MMNGKRTVADHFGPSVFHYEIIYITDKTIKIKTSLNREEQKDMAASKQRTTAASGKPAKLTGREQVDEYLNHLEHPLKPAIEEVRSIILSAPVELDEHIKWNAPSFRHRGEDRVTFNFHGKGGFMLVFHCGAKVKENKAKEPLFQDTSGLLEWVAGDRATIKFADMSDVTAKKEKLAEIVAKWIEATGA